MVEIFLDKYFYIRLTRTYYKDGTILQNNLLSTADVFINRKKYSIGVILDNESIEDHNLGNKLINNKKIDNIYYEDLPNNNHELFQAFAYPNMHWGMIDNNGQHFIWILL